MVDFTVETGEGLDNANSYASIEFADSYLNSDWAVGSDEKQNALVAATEYLDLRWGNKLKGRPLRSSQALEIPRLGLIDRYGRETQGVPVAVQRAVCLYAQRSVAGTLYPTPPSSDPKEITEKSVTVGPIKTAYKYAGTHTSGSYLSFPLADNLVQQYTYAGSNGGTMRN